MHLCLLFEISDSKTRNDNCITIFLSHSLSLSLYIYIYIYIIYIFIYMCVCVCVCVWWKMLGVIGWRNLFIQVYVPGNMRIGEKNEMYLARRKEKQNWIFNESFTQIDTSIKICFRLPSYFLSILSVYLSHSFHISPIRSLSVSPSVFLSLSLDIYIYIFMH